MGWLHPYLAGVLDSDGHLGIGKKGARVAVVQASPIIPRLFADSFGTGTVYIARDKRTSVRTPFTTGGRPYRTLHGWCADSARVVPVIQAVLPYLQLKRRQAELLLVYQQIRALPMAVVRTHGAEMVKCRNRWGVYYRPRLVIKPEIQKWRDALKAEVSRLNLGGHAHLV